MTFDRRLRRVGKVVSVFLGLVLLLLLLLHLLHVPAVQGWVADRLIGMASSRIDGDLRVGNLDYRLWSGDVSIEELVYEQGGDGMMIVVRVPEVRGHWSPLSGLEVSIFRPVVELTSLDRPPEVESTEVSTDVSDPGGALEPTLPGFLTSLSVVGGRIYWTGEESETRAEIGPFDVELASDEPVGLSGRLVVQRGRVALEEDAIRLLGGSANLRGDGSTLDVEEGRLDLDVGRLEPEAEIRTLDPFSADVAVAFRLDAAELGPLLDEPTLRGRITGNATLVVREKTVTGRGSVSAGNLSWRELGPWQSELRFELTEEALELEGLELGGYGGSLTADARLELGAGGRQTVQTRWSELSVSLLLASAGVSSARIPWESVASGEADLAMTRWDVSTLTGTGSLELEDDIEGTIAFTADAGVLRARTTALELPGGALDLDVELDDFRRLAAGLHLELGDVGPLASMILPEAWIALSGALTLDASASGDVTAPETLQAEAEVASEGFELNGRKLTLDGELRYRRETLHVSDLVLATPGTEARRLAARGAIGVRRAAPSTLALTLESFPLGVLPGRYAVAEGSVSGEVALEGDIRNPDAEALLTLEELAYRAVEGAGALSVSKSGERIRLQNLDLRLGEGEIHAEGSLNRRTGELSLVADAGGLPFPRLVEKAGVGGWPPTLDLVLARADVSLSGSLQRPEGRAEIRLEEVSFRGEELPDAAISVASSGASESESTAEVEMEVVLEPGGSALRARTELEGDYATTARLNLPSLPWTALGHAFGWDAVDAILVSGDMETRFPMARPEAFIAEANVTAISARLESITVATTEPFTVEGSAQRIEVLGLSLAGPGVDLRVDGAIGLDAGARSPSPAEPDRGSALRAEGTLDLEPWQPLVPGDGLGGNARLDLTFRGTPSRPRLQGALSLEGGRWSDGNVVVEEITGTLRADGDSVVLDELGATVLGGSLTAEGELPLPGAAIEGDPERMFRFQARDLDLATLLDGAPDGGPDDDVRLLISLDGEASLRAARRDGIEASGAITSIEIGTPASAASTTAPARFHLSRGRFGLERVELTGEGTDLVLGAEGSGSDWSAFARGRLNLLLARAVLPDSVIVGGALELDASVVGGEGELSLEGSSRLRHGELVLDEPPLVVSDVQASARLEGGEILLEELEASANGGTLSAEGRLGLGLGLGSDRANESGADTASPTSPPSLRIRAGAIRLEYPEGLRSEIDADLELSGAHDGDIYELSGRVVIDHARYGKDLSVERELLRSIRSQTVEIARDPGFASRLRLDVDVDSARGIVVDNNLGQIRAETNVLVTGTAETPEISGTVRVLQGGELTFAGNTYEIEAARVDLVGYPLSPPEVDVRARTETGGYDLVLELSGSLDNLRTSLSSPSDPSLSRADVASLLLTGRTVEQVRGEEGRVLGEQAARYLGGGLAELTETGLENALPVTSITIAPTVVGSETDPGARLSLGQAVSDDLFLTYSIGLDDTQSQLWIIDYDLPESFALRAVRDDENDYTGALSQKLLFDIYERERPVELPEIEGPAISAVRFAGELPIPENRLREKASLSAGDRFDYWRGRDDADDIREELRRAGYLGADVLFDTEPASADAPDDEEESAEEVVLTYTVRAGKPLQISWSGDDPGEELREDVRETWGVHLPPRAVASDAAARIGYRLQSEGYYDAVVETEVSESGSASEVLFLVELGQKGSGVELTFTGNSVVEEEELESLFHDPSEPEFFEMVETERDDLRESIQLLYATRGYLNARVVDLERRYDPASGVYHVDLRLDEGELAYVSEVVLDGAEEIAGETLRKELILEPGAQLRLGDFLRDRQAIASFYRGEGFPDARVRSRLRRSAAAGFDVVHEIEENERVRVGEIRIAGNVVTDDDLTREALRLRPGDPLRLEDLIETQSRLYDLQTFRSVDVRAVPTDERGVRDVVVDVVELPDVNLSYGIRYSTEELWELTGNVDLPNLLGDARRLTFSIFVNRNDQAYRTTYHVPSFFSLDLDTDLFVAREIETDDTLSSRSWSITFQQGRGDPERIRAQWSYTFRRADVEDLVLSDDPFAFHVVANRGILTGSLIHDGRDSLTRPSRGWFWNATTQFGAAALGSDLRFLRLFGQAFYFRPVIGRGVVWASSYRAGIAQPFDDQVLLPGDRFQAGGPNSVRGFPLDQLGPVDPATGARIGGEGVVVLNQELRIPLWRRFGAVAFYDAGNVFLDVRDFNPLDLRHSLGVGLRVDLPVGLFRVDWARVLNPQPGFDDSRFHFSFGHAF